MLTSLFSLFYVTGEFHRFLHRGRATIIPYMYVTNTMRSTDMGGQCNKEKINSTKN